jgi:hypothetical protein
MMRVVDEGSRAGLVGNLGEAALALVGRGDVVIRVRHVFGGGGGGGGVDLVSIRLAISTTATSITLK